MGRLTGAIADLCAGALAAAACSGEPAQTAAGPARQETVHPVSGLAMIPLASRSSGREHRFRVEVARSEQEQQQTR